MTTWHVRNSAGEWIIGITRDPMLGSIAEWGNGSPFEFESFGRAESFATFYAATVVTLEQLTLFVDVQPDLFAPYAFAGS